MKVAVTTKYGPPEVIQIQDREVPEPKPDQILIKVNATSVTAGDSRIRGARFPNGFAIPARLGLGIFAPRKKVLGYEYSGIVEKIGSNVQNFKVGDRVVGCGLTGSHSEYICVNEKSAIVLKPENISFVGAAALPFGGNTAFYFLQKAKAKAGESILVNGASGSVGVMAVQIAKSMGLNVTGVCSSSNIELVTSLGADDVIDYSNGEVFSESKKYDIIFDTVGNLTFSQCEQYLNTNGRFVALVAGLGEMINKPKGNDGKVYITGTAPEKKELLEEIVNLAKDGKIKAVIGKEFRFDEIVEAHRYVDGGHKVGSAVVKIVV